MALERLKKFLQRGPAEEAAASNLASGLLRVALVALAGLLLAMVAAPWVFRLTQSLDLTAGYPFRRVFNRVVMGSELVLFLCSWRTLRLSPPWGTYFKRQHFSKEFWPWFVIALLTMGLLTALQCWAGFRTFHSRSVGYLLSKGLTALLSALVVAGLEETIFRGLLFTALRQRLRPILAVLLTSLIFAGLHIFSLDHFLQGIKHAAADFDGCDPLAGFYHMALFMKPLKDAAVVVPGFLGLFVCSLLLCCLTLRTGSLWSAMAVHSGWVFTIKITGRIWAYDKVAAADSGLQWLLGEKFVATSSLGWALVLLETGWVLGLYGYAIYRAMQFGCNRLPIDFCYRVADAIGSLLYYIGGPKRRTALANLRMAFPEKDEAERRLIARRSFQNLARVSFSVLLMPRLAARVPSGITSKHYDRLMRAHATGPGGVVFFTAHIGCWEAQSWCSALLGVKKFTAVGRPFRNRLIYDHVVRLREKGGVELVEKKQALRPMLKTLRLGGEVGLVADQYAGGEGVPTTFFGRICSTTPAPAFLARRTGCPIVPAFCRELPGHVFEAYLYEPFFVAQTDDPDRDIREATQRAMDCLEEEIRRAPEAYLWAHRKWRKSFEEKHREN